MTTTLFSGWEVILVVQTALHIGDGTRLQRDADFVLEPLGAPTRARVIDADRALAIMDDAEIARARDGLIARALGAARREQVTRAVLPLHRAQAGHDPGEVHALIRDVNGAPYIPGSSLKGAIRTALLRQIAGRDVEAYARDEENKNAATLECRAFRQGTLPPGQQAADANRDLLRALRVSDLRPMTEDNRRPRTAFLEVEVRRVDRRGEPVLSVWIEAILRGSGFRGVLWLDRALLRRFQTAPAVRALFERLPEALRQDGRATLAAERALSDDLFRPWAEMQTQGWLCTLGWGAGWLAQTIGALVPPRQRRPLATRLRLGRGRLPDAVPFPRSYRVARLPGGRESVDRPLGLTIVTFRPLAAGATP